MPDHGGLDQMRNGATQAPRRKTRLDAELLSASIASQRSALMTAPSPYMVFTRAGESVVVNDMFTRMTGFTIAELPDIRACLIKMRRVPSADIETVLEGWQRQLGQASSKEVTVWTAWGEMRIWEIRTTEPFLWSDGRSVIMQSMFDLTEQRRLEEALRRNQEEMRVRLAELEALYFSAPLGLGMLDQNLCFVRANEALADINGVSATDHIGRFAFDVVPDLRVQSESLLRGGLETGQPIRNIEFHGETPRAPGVMRDWLQSIYPLRDASGETVGLGVIVEEVTERKKVDDELAATNAALRRTLDLLFLALRTAGVSVFTQDDQLRYLWVGGDYFGCDPDAAIGQSDASLLPPELVAPMAHLKRRVLNTQEPASADLPYIKDGKTCWCNIHVEPWKMLDGSVQSLLGAVSDVSERKETEQHIRTLLSELAHRSKNLLTVIQVMARRSVSPGLSSTAFVDSFVERLSGLAQSHDLLAREDWRGISMHELVTSQIGHLKTDTAERLIVDGPDVVLTPVAAQNLGMAIHELSTNAVKYGALSVVGGQVRITWSLFKDAAERDRMRLSWVERGGPEVVEPNRRGFGRFVIEAIAARALSGVVDLRFDPDGVSCIIEGAADDSVIAKGASAPSVT